MKHLLAILCTLVLTACGGGGGGGTSSGTVPVRALNVVTAINSNVKNIAVGDLNQDGLDDIVIGGWGGPGFNATIVVLMQNSDGTLSDRTSSILPVTTYGGSQRIFIRDFDNDGRNDIFMPGFNDGCNNSCAVNSVIFWNRPGQFAQQILPDQIDSHGACVDDINNDGLLDVLVRGVYDQATHTTQGGLYINNGNRSFTYNNTVNAGSTCSINHESNGNISIVTGNVSAILTYDANLNLLATQPVASQDASANDLIDSMSMDVNGDGHADFVLMFDNPSDNTKGRKEVWLNNGAGAYSYSYVIDSDSYNLYHHAVLVHQNQKLVYFSGDNLQAKLYKVTNGQFVAYNQTRFTEMAQQAGYYPGFNWSVGVGVVYQNTTTNRLYMLQSINGTLYTQEI